MPITASKYINNSQLRTSYLSLFNYKSPKRGKGDSEVDMYGLLSVSSSVEIPGDKIVKFAWDGIIDGFEYSKTDSINESLKLGLSEATQRVKQLIVNDTEIGKNGVDINFTIFVSSNGGMYIGVLGEGDIYVYKEGRLVDIYEMLESKKAKTAAIAIDRNDLVFSSSRGYLKENFSKLIGKKNREEIISTLEQLGNDVPDDMGLVVFSKIEREKNQIVENNKEEKLEKEISKRKLMPKEPKDTDYVPITKVNKKIFKAVTPEKDLREVLVKTFSKVSFIKPFSKKVFSFAKEFSKKSFLGIKNIVVGNIRKLKSSISKKFGRKRWFRGVSAKVSQINVKNKRKEEFREFKIDGYKQKSQRTHRAKIVVFVLLGISILTGGVKFTIDQKEARERGKTANTIFSEVEELANTANSKLGTDRESVGMLILQASDKLKDVPSELGEKDREKYEELNSQVLGIADSLYKKTRLSLKDKSIEKYYDTFTFNQDSSPEDMAIFRDSNGKELLIISDVGTKSVYSISLYDKKVENLSDANKVLDKPSKVYTKSIGIFVLDLTNGIVKSTYSNGVYEPFVKLSGLSIESMKLNSIAEFAMLTTNNNAYVLDREEKSLLRSFNYEGGYSLISPYLNKEEYQFANDIFADDLSIYITAKGENGIFRYVGSTSGMVESPISISGLDTVIKDSQAGYTIDDLNKGLYIFDGGEKRVLKFEKPLESGEKRHPNELLLLNQYLFDQEGAWNDIKDIVVDYNEKYMYILDSTTIWKVKL